MDTRKEPMKTAIPYRQIRALYDADTITVYQAYNQEIASAAVAHQRLNASPLFRPSRMTWIKPSWCWMMYRSGYSYKDKNQERILALKMKQEDFVKLLEQAVLAHGDAKARDHDGSKASDGSEHSGESRQKLGGVRVQWDPERSARLGRLEYRSIQIGVPGFLQTEWAEKWIVSIEDVTQRARDLKAALEADSEVSNQELVDRGLLLDEHVFEVTESLREVLEMD